MSNEFVPYDIALAMNELGYENEESTTVFYFYEQPHPSPKIVLDIGDAKNIDVHRQLERGHAMYLPLYQQAFRWFRKEYKLFSEVNLTTKQEDVESFEFFVLNVNEPLFESDDYTVYEEAELACLRKLIEIVKDKDENN